jgi:EAL domain-containing protein (putative c-di-GMP-specific phosphodiesterase class I)
LYRLLVVIRVAFSEGRCGAVNDWFLEGFFDQTRVSSRVRLEPLPFTIGRASHASLTLDMSGISRQQACLCVENDLLCIEDAGSTNGTFLNRQKIHGVVPVNDGDILHFGEVECRLVEVEAERGDNSKGMTRAVTPILSSEFAQGTREFQELMKDQLVTAHFQPIVHVDGRPFAYEILGRGTHPELAEAPGPLFRIAESMGLEVPFSESLRDTGLELAQSHGVDTKFFVNIHPSEFKSLPRLMNSLREFRGRMPKLQAVLEIHEGAATNLNQMRNIRVELEELGIGLAYDDFGTGQARLLEVAEVPPDYVKFDMTLIRGIDEASGTQRSMVKMLVEFCRDSEILTVAEGVEKAGEAEACRDLGFNFIQGFYFGRPGPIETVA